MKWLIASDIHGSEYYLKELIRSYKSEKADKLILLGDLLYHGPRNDLPKDYAPKAVIEILNSLKNEILCVRGNCDADVDQMVLDFPILADYAVLCYNNTLIYLTHGHVYNENNLPPLQKGDILINGHTHVAKCTEYENYTYINPGSVSIPKENTHHGYLIFEDGTFTWKDFGGNVIMAYTI